MSEPSGAAARPDTEAGRYRVLLRGSATVGNALTAGVFNSNDAREKLEPSAHQWQVSTPEGWVSIPSASAESIVLTEPLVGKRIRMLVTVAADGGHLTVCSAAAEIAAHNAIVVENRNEGAPDWKLTDLAMDHEIEGYADATSVNAGQRLDLRISLSQAGTYRLEVFRLGYYRGAGARLMFRAEGLSGGPQRSPVMADPEKRLVVCPWEVSYGLETSAQWTTGLYLVRLTASRNGKQTLIPFVLRRDEQPADIGFQDAVNTAQAYNTYGGFCAYDATSKGGLRAFQLSFDRPYAADCLGFTNSDGYNSNNMLSWEYNMVRWLESQGYDVSYYTNVDVHANPTQLYGQRTFLSVGHDEYWSREQRAAVESARDNGIHLALYSANSAYWQIRFEQYGDGEAGRTIGIYKDASGIGHDASVDPRSASDPSGATTLFRSREVNRPENALFGVGYVSDHGDIFRGFDYVVCNSDDPCYLNTGLKDGDRLAGLVGYEWDAVMDNEATPPGLVLLSRSPTRPNPILPPLPGATRPDVSHAVRYTAASGSIVFATGSIQWVWGLDDELVTPPPQVKLRWRSRLKRWVKGLLKPGFAATMPRLPRQDRRARQIAVNVFAEMGVRPQTPSADIVVG